MIDSVTLVLVCYSTRTHRPQGCRARRTGDTPMYSRIGPSSRPRSGSGGSGLHGCCHGAVNSGVAVSVAVNRPATPSGG